MKNLTRIILAVAFPFLMFSQEKGAIGIEFNSNFNIINTMELDKSYDRLSEELPANTTLLSREKMERGLDFGLNLNYQLNQFFNIGIYSKYAQAKSANEYRTIDASGVFMNLPIDTAYYVNTYSMMNSIVGIYSDFSINNFAFWPTDNWLSRIESKITLGVGYSHSKFIKSTDQNLSEGFFGEVNPVSGLHLMGNLKLGYKISRNPVFSSVGIQLGYQSLMTRHLKGDALITFKENESPRLNFSGFTTGLYLIFGK